MAYGLKVWDEAGGGRVYETSWFMKFHQDYDVTIGPGVTQDVSIPGFVPNSWAVVNLQAIPLGAITYAMGATLGFEQHNGFVRLINTQNSNQARYTFRVLKG